MRLMNRYRSILVGALALCAACDREEDPASASSPAAVKRSTHESKPAEDDLETLNRNLKAQGAQLKVDLKAKADATPNRL